MHLIARITVLSAAVLAAAPAPAVETAAAFCHPGVILNREQLSLIKQRVAAGVEPQATAFATLLASPLADLNYTPSPRATVECGPRSNPDLGCKDERRDCTAAYSQALAWHITGNAQYARNAIRIMNAWAGTLTGGHQLAYNHFHHRLGRELPMMANVLPTNRPTGTDSNHMVWETLTHGEVGAVGLPAIAR